MKTKFILGMLMLVALVSLTSTAAVENAPKVKVDTDLISQRIAAIQIVEAQVQLVKVGVGSTVVIGKTVIVSDPCAGQSNCYCTTTYETDCEAQLTATITNCYNSTCSPTCWPNHFYSSYSWAPMAPQTPCD